MRRIRIKICGITRAEDALAAANAGVDALGFIFAPKSPRYIAPEAAAVIIQQLPPFISRVGVFVDESAETVTRVASISGVDTVQLHGAESAEMCRSLDIPVVKSFGLRPDLTVKELEAYTVAGYLLDTWKGALQGGSGICGNWEVASTVAATCYRVVLAGGLTPDNVREALEKVVPYGVDLNSGCETAPGIKDPQKILAAVAAVRAWERCA